MRKGTSNCTGQTLKWFRSWEELEKLLWKQFSERGLYFPCECIDQGVLFDLALLFDARCWLWPGVVFAKLQQVNQLFLDKTNMDTVIHALVTPRLVHSNVLYVSLPLKSIWKCELQNVAATLVSRMQFCFICSGF